MNPRLRGKIKHSEWPRIAEAFAAGETLTQIARRYGCTAPAIRYIVRRQQASSERRMVPSDRRERFEHNSWPAEERLFSPDSPRSADAVEEVRSGRAPMRRSSLPDTFWARVSSDIAGFLAAMDAMILDGNEKTETALLGAADRLLRVSALTRLEIERIRSSRKESLHVV